MKDERGLSEVVTTVVVIALALVAITILWAVISQLISSNSRSVKAQQMCLNTQFDLKGSFVENSVTSLRVRRISGSDTLGGIVFWAHNLTDGSSTNYSGNIAVGQSILGEISIINAKEVSVVPYFEIDSKIFPCSQLC